MFQKFKTRFIILLCFVLFVFMFINAWFIHAFAADTSFHLPKFYDSCSKIQLFPQENGSSVLIGFKNNACRTDILSEYGKSISTFQTAFSSEKAVFCHKHLFLIKQCGKHYGFVYANIKTNLSFSETHIIPIKYGSLMQCECDSFGRLYCLSSENADSILVLNSQGQPISTIKAENQKIQSFSVTPNNFLFIKTTDSVYRVNLPSFDSYRLSDTFIPKFPLYFLNKSTAVDSCGTLVIEKNGRFAKDYELPVSATKLAIS